MMPILYSFRRCPYAVRARLAILAAKQCVELREVLLRDKAPEFLEVSASGTVPCLEVDGYAIDESLDIMRWALKKHDPEGWLDMPQEGWDLIEQADGPFKQALDRTKYASRYPDIDLRESRADAMAFLYQLEERMDDWIFDKPTIADFAILPFVRQFAFIDKTLFDAQDLPNIHRWLEDFLSSRLFNDAMVKYEKWVSGDQPIVFCPYEKTEVKTAGF